MVKTSLIRAYLGGWTGENMQDVGKRRKKASKIEELERLKASYAYKALKVGHEEQSRQIYIAKAKKIVKKGKGKKSTKKVREAKTRLSHLRHQSNISKTKRKRLRQKVERTQGRISLI